MAVLDSPLRGWVTSLDEVPDPVFARRMLGDGVAIEPTGSTLHAPCDADVVSVHAGGHAVTLRTKDGAELLIHIGVDTVALGGEGFRPHVAQGDRVLRGDPLIAFDLNLLLDRAPSVITPILVNNPDHFEIVHGDVDRAIMVGEPLMTLTRRASLEAPASIAGDTCHRDIIVPMAHGIHARPTGRIAELARRFTADISIAAGERSANARSAVSLLTLGVKCGDVIQVRATGGDAGDALREVCALIGSGMDEGGAVETRPRPAPAAAPIPDTHAVAGNGRVVGVQAAPGLAVGKAVWLRHDEGVVPENGISQTEEGRRLTMAIDTAIGRLAHAGASSAGILNAHRALLDDPELRAGADRAIADGRSAEYAWRSSLRAQAALLRGLGDPRLAERADDLLDVERQVIAVLTGREAALASFPAGTILLADDLLPSDLIRIGPNGIAGFGTVRGGPTSHVAILAASMNIPGIVAAGPALAAIRDGADLILDADDASLRVDPDDAALSAARDRIEQTARRRAEVRMRALAPAITTDGTRIEVFANLASLDDALVAVEHGAEGCGLLRTEFLFLDRAQAPDESEQAAQYQAIADALDGRPLIIRLLDIGGDKPAAYLPIAAEDNPALGLRGIRVGLTHPAILETQLRAILRVTPAGRCRVMVPMVASVAEFSAVRAAFDDARRSLGMDDPIELGVMIETPAAAITTDLIAELADFVSIGTNDLTQYVLAMDRGNPAVAAGIDAFHPAVLRMIASTCEGAAAHGRSAGMCGGLASDPLATPLLIGLGVEELSVTPALIPEVKAVVRTVALDDCRRVAREALRLSSPQAVRELARRFRQERG